jgi:hypothetical protein
MAPSIAARSLPAGQCYQGHLSDELLWPTSGVADLEDQGSTLFVDVPTQKLVRVGPQGRTEELTVQKLPELRPQLIRSAQDGYLVLEYVDYFYRFKVVDRPRIHRLDVSLGSVTTFAYQPQLVLGIYDFVEWRTGILAFGALETKPGHYWAGLFSMSEQGEIQKIRELYNPHDPVLRHYGTSDTIRFLARVDGPPARAYLLALEESPWLGRIDEETGAFHEFRTLPGEFGFPNLKQLAAADLEQGFSKLMSLMSGLERESGAVSGLYSDGTGVYLLARSLEDGQTTSWWSIRLSPENGAEISRMRLPVSNDAAHLTIVSGKRDFWTIIEKDAAQPMIFDREVLPFLRASRLRQIPSDWIQSSHSLSYQDACHFLNLQW